MSEVTFEPGDVVTCAFYGDEEFVLSSEDGGLFPISINRGGKVIAFTLDGMYSTHHTAPVLKLVRKKAKNRNAIGLFKVSSENESFFLENNEFRTYEDAFDWIKKNGIIGWVYSIDKFYKINDL